MPRSLFAMDHPSDNLTSLKYSYAAVTFFATILTGVSSYKLLKWRGEKWIVIACRFAAGVFLGTAMIECLSESGIVFHVLGFRYPFAFLLACAGYLVAMIKGFRGFRKSSFLTLAVLVLLLAAGATSQPADDWQEENKDPPQKEQPRSSWFARHWKDILIYGSIIVLILIILCAIITVICTYRNEPAQNEGVEMVPLAIPTIQTEIREPDNEAVAPPAGPPARMEVARRPVMSFSIFVFVVTFCYLLFQYFV